MSHQASSPVRIPDVTILEVFLQWTNFFIYVFLFVARLSSRVNMFSCEHVHLLTLLNKILVVTILESSSWMFEETSKFEVGLSQQHHGNLPIISVILSDKVVIDRSTRIASHFSLKFRVWALFSEQVPRRFREGLPGNVVCRWKEMKRQFSKLIISKLLICPIVSISMKSFQAERSESLFCSDQLNDERLPAGPPTAFNSNCFTLTIWI